MKESLLSAPTGLSRGVSRLSLLHESLLSLKGEYALSRLDQLRSSRKAEDFLSSLELYPRSDLDGDLGLAQPPPFLLGLRSLFGIRGDLDLALLLVLGPSLFSPRTI